MQHLVQFLDLVQKGHCYHKESPALWCNECLTSIAQAELETKTIKTSFSYINYETTDKEVFNVDENEEYQHYVIRKGIVLKLAISSAPLI